MPVINIPVVDMRAAPNHLSEVVSQALYAEEIEIMDRHADWINIKTTIDSYSGWIPNDDHILREMQRKSPDIKYCYVSRNAAHVYATKDTIYGPLLTLPYETPLEIIEDNKQEVRWISIRLVDGQQAYIQKGDITYENSALSIDQVAQLSLQFLGLPYTWGGRSSFGYDCSGFIQMLYRKMHIYLPRDSYQQFSCPLLQDTSLDNLKKGDLIFFGFASDKIKHVAFSLGQETFIHTCAITENKPYMRYSKLNDEAWNGTGYYPYRAAKQISPQHGI